MPVSPVSSVATRERMAALDVEALVSLAQQTGPGRMAALEELVRRYQKTVYAALYHLAPQRTDLADLTQDALLRMCRSIHTLRSPKTFKFWLNRIITNIFYDELRKKPRSLNTVSMDAPWASDDDEPMAATRDIADTAQQPDFLALGGELDEQIRQAIVNLPEHFRTMVVLREIQGLSYEDIASLTGANLGTVKSRLARARQKLQEALEPYIRGDS